MCKKKKFNSKLDAMLALARCNANKRLETKVYFCKQCNAYHLTKWKKYQNFYFN